MQAADPDGDALLWYTWDFDAADGAGVDDVGKTAARLFKKPGTYVVSATAMDATGVPGRWHLRITVD